MDFDKSNYHSMLADFLNTADKTVNDVAGNFMWQINNFIPCDFIKLELLCEIFHEICWWNRIQHIFVHKKCITEEIKLIQICARRRKTSNFDTFFGTFGETQKCLSASYLWNQMTDSGQTSYIVTLGWFKDLIRFLWPWPNFQGHHTIKTLKFSNFDQTKLVCTLSLVPNDDIVMLGWF